jgi:hypothetical protein
MNTNAVSQIPISSYPKIPGMPEYQQSKSPFN